MASADGCVRRVCGAALLLLASMRASSSAHAQPSEALELRWSAPAECPDRAEVLARIRELAVEWPPAGPPLRAAATIERSRAGRFVLALVVRSGDAVGEREIRGKTCNDVARAAAIHLALLLDAKGADQNRPSDAASAGDGQGASDAPSPAEPPGNARELEIARTPSPSIAEHPSDATETRRIRRWLIQAPAGLLQLGVLPEPCFGIAAGLGVALGHWRLLAQARLWLPQDITAKDDFSVHAKVKRASFDARACFTFAWSTVELDPCLDVTVEHAWVRGSGSFVASRTARVTWIGVGAGAQARVHVFDGMSLLAGLDAQLEGNRSTITVRDFGTLGQLGPFALTLTLGSEWIL